MKKTHILTTDDRGLSLVELLVAVAILAVAIIPLTRGFLTSAHVAADAAALGNATGAARNVAEVIEATDLNVLGELLDAGQLGGFNVKNGSVVITPAKDDKDPRADAFAFTLEDVQYSGSTFDADVVMTAAGERYAAVNAEELTKYTSMDAAFSQPVGDKSPDTRALGEFESTKATLENGAIKNASLKRAVCLSITGGETTVTAVITYKYSCTVTYTVTSYDEDGKPVIQNCELPCEAAYPYTVTGSIRDGDRNGAEDKKTPAVYIMFFTAPDGFTDGGIEITAAADCTVPLFLALQSDTKDAVKVSLTGAAKLFSNASLDLTFTDALHDIAAQNRLYAVTIVLTSDGAEIYTLETTKID